MKHLKNILLLLVLLLALPLYSFSEDTSSQTTNGAKKSQTQEIMSEQTYQKSSNNTNLQNQASTAQTQKLSSSNQQSQTLEELQEKITNSLLKLKTQVSMQPEQLTKLLDSGQSIQTWSNDCKKTIEELKTDLNQVSERLQESNEWVSDAYKELEYYDAKFVTIENRLSRSGVVNIATISAATAGGAIIGYSLANEDTTMLLVGIGITAGTTLVYSCGHWTFKFW